MIKDSNKS